MNKMYTTNLVTATANFTHGYMTITGTFIFVMAKMNEILKDRGDRETLISFDLGYILRDNLVNRGIDISKYTDPEVVNMRFDLQTAPMLSA